MSVITVDRIANELGLKEMSPSKLQEVADRTRGSLKEVKDFIKEQGQEFKWTGEYIAAVIGVDRTPKADLVRRANMTRADFVKMKREMEKGPENKQEQEK